MGYKYQFLHIPYILHAKVTRAGPFPPTIATLGASIVRHCCGCCGYGCGCGCYCGYYCLRLWCICGASAVRLRCARGTPAVRLWCSGFLQRDSCRLVVVKVGVAVVVCSVIAADWLWSGSYILASNTVEFNMPAYPGLYPSFLILCPNL